MGGLGSAPDPAGGAYSAGKVTVGLALYWPCDTDFSGLSTHGLLEGNEHPDNAAHGVSTYGTLYLMHDTYIQVK